MNDNQSSNPFDEDEKDSKWSNAPIGIDESPTFSSMDEEESTGKTVRLILLISGIAGCCIVAILAYMFFQPATPPLIARLFPSPTFTATRTPAPTSTVTPTPTRTSTPTITYTPTITLTPHALIPAPENAKVFSEQFDSSKNRWESYYGDNTTLIKEGKLYIKSDKAGYVGLASCNGCPIYKAFYFQAEVVPEKSSGAQHGIAFCATLLRNEYYVFIINSTYQTYSVYKRIPSDWIILFNNVSSKLINQFPISNTLAVEYNQGWMELYINGDLVNTYIDLEPYSGRGFGVFIDAGLMDVIADNVFVYEIKETPLPTLTPTP